MRSRTQGGQLKKPEETQGRCMPYLHISVPASLLKLRPTLRNTWYVRKKKKKYMLCQKPGHTLISIIS